MFLGLIGISGNWSLHVVLNHFRSVGQALLGDTLEGFGLQRLVLRFAVWSARSMGRPRLKPGD